MNACALGRAVVQSRYEVHMQSPQLRLRVPRELKEAIDRDAKDRCTTPSEVVRAAIVEDQRRRGNWPPKREHQ